MSIECKHDTCRNKYECERRVSDGMIATTHGTGPFHPAVRFGKMLWYWPNITFEREDTACEWAIESIRGALESAQRHTDEWNIYQA